MNLDLSKFRKVEAGDKHTVLEHEKGRVLKIAHHGLSPEFRKQLEEMPVQLAKGGYAKFSQKFDPNMGSKASKPSRSSSTMPGNQAAASKAFTEPDDMGTNIPKQMLKDGMAEGQYPDVVVNSLNKKAPPYGALSAEPEQHYPPCINPSCKSFGKSHPNCRCYGGNPEGKESHQFAEGGAVEKEYYCDANRTHRKGCEYFKDGGGVESDKLEQAKQDVNAELQNQTPPDDSSQQSSSPMPTPLPPPMSPNAEVSSQPEQASTEPTPEPAPAPEPGQPTTQTQQVPDITPEVNKAQQTTAALSNESQQVQQDLNSGQIKPETYKQLFDNKGVPGKIGTIFGLLFSGMGSGLSHQPNMLMGMMDKEIERDLDAQQKSVGNKQNFMRIAQQGLLNQSHVTGQNLANQTNARALAWSYAARSMLHQQVQQAMALPQGPQRQQAMQALTIMGQNIDQKEADQFSRAGLAQAIQESNFGGQSGGQPNTTMMKSGLAGPAFKEMGSDIEQKTIPGVPGQAQRPIPEATRDQVQNMNVLDQKAKDLIGYAKKHEGSWNPQTRAIAQQKANEMVGFYSSSLGTSMTEGTRTWLDDQIAKKNPTSMIAQELMGSNSRLKEIQDSNNMRRSTLLGSVGLKGPEAQKQQSQGASSKAGHAIEYRNGKAYYK